MLPLNDARLMILGSSRHRRFVWMLVLVALALPAVASSRSSLDKGRRTPPPAYLDVKGLWLVE